KLFVAGIIPGLLAATMYMITVGIIGIARPNFLPSTPRHSWNDRFGATRDVWATLLLFVFVIGTADCLRRPKLAAWVPAGPSGLAGCVADSIVSKSVTHCCKQRVRLPRYSRC